MPEIAAVDQTNNGIQQGITALRQAAADTPFLTTFIKALESAKCTAQGEKATLSANIEGNAAMMIAPILFATRSAPEPVAPVQAPGIAPPPQPVPPRVDVVK